MRVLTRTTRWGTHAHSTDRPAPFLASGIVGLGYPRLHGLAESPDVGPELHEANRAQQLFLVAVNLGQHCCGISRPAAR